MVSFLFVQSTYLYVFLSKVTFRYSFKEFESWCWSFFKEVFITLWKTFVLFTRKWIIFYRVCFKITLWFAILLRYQTLLSIVIFLKVNFFKKTLTLLYHLIVQTQNSRFKIHSYNFCQVNYLWTITCTKTIIFLNPVFRIWTISISFYNKCSLFLWRRTSITIRVIFIHMTNPMSTFCRVQIHNSNIT